MTLDIVVRNSNSSPLVLSRYAGDDLAEVLKAYNTPDSLLVVDIDDCVRKSPAKKMAISGFVDPALLIPNLFWGYYTLKEVISHLFDGGTIKDAETASFRYYVENVLPKLSVEKKEALIRKSLTPFFPYAQEFVRSFPKAHSVIVSRNIPEIVEETRNALGCKNAYPRKDDKAEVVIAYVHNTNCQRVLIIGDSAEDAAPIPRLQQLRVPVDFLYVMKSLDTKNVHPTATIAIQRNGFLSLYEMVK